jgi:hypothetical protein
MGESVRCHRVSGDPGRDVSKDRIANRMLVNLLPACKDT